MIGTDNFHFPKEIYTKEFILELSKKTAIGGNPSPVLKEMVKFGTIEPKESVLDFGKGKGRNSNYLIDQGFDVDVYDISSDESLPEKQVYDVILLQYVLNVILYESRLDVLDQIRNYCDEHTKILIEVRSESQLIRSQKKRNYEWPLYEDGYITTKHTFQKGYTEGELVSFLNEHGFRVQRVLYDDKDKTSLIATI